MVANGYVEALTTRTPPGTAAVHGGSDLPLVRVLGPVDLVRLDGTVVAPATPLRRTLLALLVLADGSVVDGDRLLELAWAGDPPKSGRRALRFHISKLRDELGDDIVETVGSGYRLAASTDLERFDSDPDAGSAIAMWRGHPFADAAQCVELEHASARLEASRVVRVEQHGAALLSQSRANETIDLVTPVCLANPLRESMWGLLAQAHYAAGNQVDALRLLAELRTRLRDELGVDPSPEIEQVELRILRHEDQGDTAGADPSRPNDPARAVRRRRGNLVRPATAFIGRREQLDALEVTLAETRLLTITGPGGAGKTRLALELGERLVRRFDNGVWVIDLSQLDATRNIEDEIIATMGLHRGAGRTTRQTLCDALDSQATLLIFDTCEHVVAAASDLAEYLIQRCPDLTIVATSRATLGAPSGVTRAIEGLGSDAVDLFAIRAAATRHGFTLTEKNRAFVEQICSRLDDLPLAIELVAARVGTFDIETLVDRLADVFRVATDTAQSRTERHRTLESAIAWSYELLGESEQALFRRLTVFRGSCTLEAIEDVCSDESLPETEIGELVEQLVETSILMTSDDVWLGRRYRLLDTTRSYASARLTEAGDLDLWREQHAQHYARWVNDGRNRVWGDQAGRARRQGLAEIPNLAAAADWAIAHADLDAALSLAASAGTFLNPACRYDAGPWLAPALDLEGAEAHPLFLAALLGVRSQLWGAGDMDGTEELTERGLRIKERNPMLHVLLMPTLRSKAQRSSPPDQALLDRAHWHARRAFELAGDDPAAKIMCGTSYLAQLHERGCHDQIVEVWAALDALAAAHPSDAMRVFAANAASTLSLIDPERARPVLEKALPMSIELHIPFMTTRILGHLAFIEAQSGDTSAAVGRLSEAIDADVSSGSWFAAFGWMHRLVPVLVDAGHLAEAVRLHHAIPNQGMIWVGDAPVDALADAGTALGADRVDELAELGRTMSRAELLVWLRSTIERVLEQNPAQ